MSSSDNSCNPTHATSPLSYLSPDNPCTWQSFLQQIDQVKPYMGELTYWMDALSRPKRTFIVDVPVILDNGTIAHFEGFRVQHNTSRGPAKGGIRFHKNATLSDTIAHAGKMTIKHAIANLPFGGAHGAIRIDPAQYSQHELERITRRYTTEISIFLGPHKDIIAPDLNTNPRIMAWMMDTQAFVTGNSAADTITGKPQSLGGTAISKDATGLGILYTAIDAARRMGMPMQNISVAVQGFGRVGGSVARLFSKAGANVIAIQDETGSTYNPAGLHIQKLKDHVAQTGGVFDFAGGQDISNEDFWKVNAFLLIPAAMENQITEKNVPLIQAKLIIEGANSPISPEADRILEDKNIIIIPDVLANIGGATVNYFEWLQNFSTIFWTEDKIKERLAHVMRDAFSAVWDVFEEHGVSMRTAAFIVACKRILDARSQRGVFP